MDVPSQDPRGFSSPMPHLLLPRGGRFIGQMLGGDVGCSLLRAYIELLGPGVDASDRGPPLPAQDLRDGRVFGSQQLRERSQ